MGRAQPLSTALVALVALAVGFLLAGQVKAQLLTPSNQVGRNQALIRSVQDLERTNQADRTKIEALRGEIDALEAQAASQSQTTQGLKNQVADLRAHAGLTPLHGPGVQVGLANGPPGSDPSGQGRNLVTYQDVLRLREIQYQLTLGVRGAPNESLPAFDGSLEAPHVGPA